MKYLLRFFCILLSFHLPAQESVTFKGKVVEVQNDKVVGVPGVVVSVSGESYDVTAQDGSFKLYAPKGLDFVTITIKGSSSAMISPYEGKVNIPPMFEPIEIKLCNEHNTKLQEKVNALNSKMRLLQKSQKLSARQLELMHKTMLDTIEHFQVMVEKYQMDIAKSEVKQKELQDKIVVLEQKNAALEEKLFEALGKKFALQQSTFDEISKGLNNYISRLKDLQLILPTDAVACVTNASGACGKFYGYIEKYNAARNFINDNKDQQETAASHYWDDPSVAMQLNATYDFVLNKLHEPFLFDKMNNTVISVLKQRSQGNISLKAAKKTLHTNCNELSNDLKPLIAELDFKKNKLYQLFLNSVQ
ncbi:MAG: hypothetical protein ABI844_16850 [Saprospiraceae bacterium]